MAYPGYPAYDGGFGGGYPNVMGGPNMMNPYGGGNPYPNQPFPQAYPNPQGTYPTGPYGGGWSDPTTQPQGTVWDPTTGQYMPPQPSYTGGYQQPQPYGGGPQPQPTYPYNNPNTNNNPPFTNSNPNTYPNTGPVVNPNVVNPQPSYLGSNPHPTSYPTTGVVNPNVAVNPQPSYLGTNPHPSSYPTTGPINPSYPTTGSVDPNQQFNANNNNNYPSYMGTNPSSNPNPSHPSSYPTTGAINPNTPLSYPTTGSVNPNTNLSYPTTGPVNANTPSYPTTGAVDPSQVQQVQSLQQQSQQDVPSDQPKRWQSQTNQRAQSSRVVLGRPISKQLTSENSTVKERIEDHKTFTGEFTIQYDNTKFVSSEEDVEIFSRGDGIPVTVTSEHSPKLTAMLKITDNQSCIYYGNYGFVYLKYIKKIEVGNTIGKDPNDSNAFTIYYGPNLFTFQFASVEAMKMCGNAIIGCSEKLKYINSFRRLSQDVWKTKTRERVDEEEALRLIRDNINSYFETTQSLFKVFFKQICPNGVVDNVDQFHSLLLSLMRYDEELLVLWNEVSSHSDTITMDQMIKFLLETQKEKEIDREELNRFFGPHDIVMNKFLDYMSNPFVNNGLVSENYITQDMNQPLPAYYINSSHNTYCTGDQYKNKSSVEMYTKLLRDGVRCIELDCWNGQNNAPDIFHGNTLTSKIKFVDVVRAIRDNAFITSKFPVILSIENHCDLNQQEVMAKAFIDILGEFLAYPPTLENQNSVIDSPNTLAYKILVKGSQITSEVNYDPTTNTYIVAQGGSKNIHDSLAKLIFLKSSHLDVASPPLNKYSMCSIDELKISKCLSDCPTDYTKFTQSYFVRTYPKGTRVDSSNYSPMPAWLLGAQMVALNLQTSGSHIYVNQSLYLGNGNCGYILKPKAISEDKAYNPNAVSTLVSSTSNISFLKIQIISARNLPDLVENNYITLDTGKPKKQKKSSKKQDKVKQTNMTMKVYGVESNDGQKQVEAGESSGNTWRCKYGLGYDYQPIFSDLSFFVAKITKGKKSGSVLGYFTLPIFQLKEGYRVVNLYDCDMNFCPFSTMLIYVRIERK